MKKIVTILFFTISLSTNAQTYGPQLAGTVMNIWKDSFALNDKPAKWTYDMGVVLKGIEYQWLNTGDARYFQYLQKQMDFFVREDGSIKTYKPEEFNIDNINNGRILLTLYKVTLKEKYLKAANLLREQLRNHPRTNEGGFWHKKIYPYQMWLDGLYMAEPFYAEYAVLAHEDSAFDDIANQFIWSENHCRNKTTGLLYHGWDESKKESWSNPATGCSQESWARAMGWYTSALVDVLEWFPVNHPKQKELVAILNRLAVTIQKYQDPKTGLWLDVLNYNGPGKEKNYFETSASCQFVYSIAKAVRKGYIPAAKIDIAKKGFAGIKTSFVKNNGDEYTLAGTVKVSGLGGKPYRDGSFNYYMTEPVIDNDPKGLGVFLMAAAEMEIQPTQSLGKGKLVLMDNYFNRETKKDAFNQTISFHYKWWERDNGGFSFVNHIVEKNGGKTALLDAAPTKANLKKASVYFLIDPDWPKENKTPNYINEEHIEALVDFVKNGGVLVLLANDSNNVEFEHYNKLASRFGIQWDINVRHDVKNDQFEQGLVDLTKALSIFKQAKKGYIKQLCTQQIKSPAKSLYSENDEVLMSVSKLGKGTVFALGDPWFYNEYVDGRKLPAEYQNYLAADDLIKWLLLQVKK
jgi:unsaturated rhamnogalacturonyl hydrolase